MLGLENTSYKVKAVMMLNHLSSNSRDLLTRVFSDLDTTQLVDYHAHYFGYGVDPKENVFLNPTLLDWRHPVQYGRFIVFKRALGLKLGNKPAQEITAEILNKLLEMLNTFVDGEGNKIPIRVCLLAFDKAYRDDGTMDLDQTEMYASNEIVFEIASQYPQDFIPVISVHPYRPDAIDELKRCYQKGARMVKWLPNVMGIDPSSDKCDSFYAFLRDHHMTLLSHTGMELSLRTSGRQSFGNPLLLCKPLEMGVKVIAAHCAALGRKNFYQWVQLMHRYDNLYGDISSIISIPMMGKIRKLLELREFHHRLVNGTDWPLPTLGFTVSTLAMQLMGHITKDERKALNEIYTFNPLLFDFALKRVIKHPKDPNLTFPPSVFQLNKELNL